MLRILKSIQEFEDSTCRTLGDGIQLKKKGSDDVFLNGIITGYYFEKNVVSIGLTYLSLKDLYENFLYLDLRGKWREFGIEEKPAKFKVGHRYKKYKDQNNEIFTVIAKYTSPTDGNTYVVIESNKRTDEPVIRLVNKSCLENEFIVIDDKSIMNKCSAKDEVKE